VNRLVGTRVRVYLILIGFWIGSKDYLHNTPLLPLEMEKMEFILAIDRMMIKMEIKISFRNNYLYLPDSILLGACLIISSGSNGVIGYLEHVFEVLHTIL
jgi:hypothetical protein